MKTTTPKKTCRIAGCRKPSRARGLCWTHYQRERRHGSSAIVQDNRGRDHIHQAADRRPGPIRESDYL